jgi:carbonic anhydrase
VIDSSSNYFFQGEYYYLYSAESDGVEPGWPKKIADDFKAKPGQSERIPDNIDTVYFDYRDQNYYFFKGEWVSSCPCCTTVIRK